MEPEKLIWFGVLGGAIPDVIRIIKNRYSKKFPNYLQSLNFWLGVGLQMGLGGLLAYALPPTDVMQALLIGYSAPSIFTQLAASQAGDESRVDKGGPGKSFSLLRWWNL